METTNPRKAGALIINNLSMFNEAAILLEQQIEVKVFEIIEEIINDWIKENGWEGSAEWLNGEENIWMSPREWYLFEEDQLHIAMFGFGYEHENSFSYNIADLCNCGQSRLGFYFAKGDGIKKSFWKKYSISEKEYLDKLEFFGFKKTDDVEFPWFIPVILDNIKLASAYENDDFDDVMQPLHEALDTLLKAKCLFDPIVKEISTAVK